MVLERGCVSVGQLIDGLVNQHTPWKGPLGSFRCRNNSISLCCRKRHSRLKNTPHMNRFGNTPAFIAYAGMHHSKKEEIASKSMTDNIVCDSESVSGDEVQHVDEDNDDDTNSPKGAAKGNESVIYTKIENLEQKYSSKFPHNTKYTAWRLENLLSEGKFHIPGRYKLVMATSLAFVIGNMDKVNISIAIIPMANDFGWSSTISGLVQSSFFYGYLLSQIPGGYATSRFGGRKILPLGVGLWSAATAALPIVAGNFSGLYISRSLVGLGEGIAPSAATDMVARVIDPSERSRAISFIFSGLHVGSLLGLFLTPAMIDLWDWPSVFYVFGGIGILWTIWWENLLSEIGYKDANILEKLSGSMSSTIDVIHESDEEFAMRDRNNVLKFSKDNDVEYEQQSSNLVQEKPSTIPWRGFLRNNPVRALAYTHFCNNWFHYTMLAWLPTYFTDTLSVNLTSAARISLLPPIAAIAVSSVAGTLADDMISRGVNVAIVRKAAQCIAFLGPAFCLLGVEWLSDGADSEAVIALVALSLGLSSFSLAGLYCNHADLSPKYAPILLGLTNTCGAVPGIIGVAVTGWLYDKTNSWNLSLFAPTIVLFLSGSAVFLAFGKAERQNFDSKSSNRPFRTEKVARIFFKKLLNRKRK